MKVRTMTRGAELEDTGSVAATRLDLLLGLAILCNLGFLLQSEHGLVHVSAAYGFVSGLLVLSWRCLPGRSAASSSLRTSSSIRSSSTS